jgi:hypothetical protein
MTSNSEWHDERNAGNDASESKSPDQPKKTWVAPELREFGHLSFVVKGISYNPLDGISNLTP